MYQKVILLLAALFIAVGCVSTRQVPLSADSAQSLNNRSVSIASRAKPDFGAMTAGKAMFAMVGAVAMIAAGNEIVRANNIEDPANYISQSLRTDLSKRYRTKSIDAPVAVGNEDLAELKKNHPNTDLLLDVQTINWSFAYFPTTWTRYRVIYSAKLRLIDVVHSNVVAEGFCARVPDETPAAPTHDELLANNAERLKRELREAADFCIGEFKSKTFPM